MIVSRCDEMNSLTIHIHFAYHTDKTKHLNKGLKSLIYLLLWRSWFKRPIFYRLKINGKTKRAHPSNVCVSQRKRFHFRVTTINAQLLTIPATFLVQTATRTKIKEIDSLIICI